MHGCDGFMCPAKSRFLMCIVYLPGAKGYYPIGFSYIQHVQCRSQITSVHSKAQAVPSIHRDSIAKTPLPRCIPHRVERSSASFTHGMGMGTGEKELYTSEC